MKTGDKDNIKILNLLKHSIRKIKYKYFVLFHLFYLLLSLAPLVTFIIFLWAKMFRLKRNCAIPSSNHRIFDSMIDFQLKSLFTHKILSSDAFHSIANGNASTNRISFDYWFQLFFFTFSLEPISNNVFLYLINIIDNNFTLFNYYFPLVIQCLGFIFCFTKNRNKIILH